LRENNVKSRLSSFRHTIYCHKCKYFFHTFNTSKRSVERSVEASNAATAGLSRFYNTFNTFCLCTLWN